MDEHHRRDRRSPRLASARTSYAVQPGDSLWAIAARHIGPRASDAAIARQVHRLWKHNADRIATGDPNLIHPGQTLILP